MSRQKRDWISPIKRGALERRLNGGVQIGTAVNRSVFRLIGEDGAQALAIGGKFQSDAKILPQARIADALVVGVEAGRHRRQLRILETGLGRRRHVQQLGGVRHHVLRRRRLVIGDVVDVLRTAPVDAGENRRWPGPSSLAAIYSSDPAARRWALPSTLTR